MWLDGWMMVGMTMSTVMNMIDWFDHDDMTHKYPDDGGYRCGDYYDSRRQQWD